MEHVVTPVKRREGACNECAQRKRKCDQQRPKCSECLKHDRHCILKTFRSWKGYLDIAGAKLTPRVRTRRGGDKRPQNASLAYTTPAIWSRDTDPGRAVGALEEVTTVFADAEIPITPLQDWFQASPPIASAFQNDFVTWDGTTLEDSSDLDAASSLASQVRVLYPEKGLIAQSYPNSGRDQTSPLLQRDRSLFRSTVSVGRSGNRAFLWNYFVVNVTKWFFCWEPNNLCRAASFQESYAVALPMLAIESPTLRLAALALSASQYTEDNSIGQDMEPLAFFLGFEAYQNFIAKMFPPSDDQRQLLIFVAVASFLVLLDPKTYSSILPLSRKAAAFLASTRHHATQQDDTDVPTILHLFRWSDLCAQCSLIKFVPLSEEYVHDLLNMDEWELNFILSAQTRKSMIHPLWCFSRRYINPFIKLARLIRMRQNESSITLDSAQSGQSDPQVEELEQLLLAAREADAESMLAEPTDYSADLLHLNEAICSTIELLLYTRLKDVAWTTPFVRRQVRIIYENMSYVAPSHPTSLGAVFPLYCAGLEAVDIGAREAIVARLHCLPGYWSRREGRLLASLEHVWGIRDQSPGDPWSTWACKVCNDVADCIPV